MVAEKSPADEISTVVQSIAMLKAVIEGATYETVAQAHGISRTAVERRVKGLAKQLSASVGISGLREEEAAFVRRLRKHRDAILAALDCFKPQRCQKPQERRIASQAEVLHGATRISVRSGHPRRDVALFLALFATGARPLEIARLEVRDYLAADGSIRQESSLRQEVAITGKERPLCFSSSSLTAALDQYLHERSENNLGTTESREYRGLDPRSRLFLSVAGEGFAITPYGSDGQRRFLCRPILETYKKLFRYAGLHDVTALSARRSVISWLYARGADEAQVGLLLGISERSAVRELLKRQRPSIPELVHELV